MTLIKCDRCGKELRDSDEVFIVDMGARDRWVVCKPDRYDLCADCNETLLAWLNPEDRGEQK